MNIDSARQTFFIEALEMLDEMERCLLSLEESPDDSETTNGLFRSIHTIKGSSGMFGLTGVMNFTHTVENVLDNFRQGKIPFSQELSAMLLKSHDHIKAMIEHCRKTDDAPMDEDFTNEGNGISSGLTAFIPEDLIEKKVSSAIDTAADEKKASRIIINRYWKISLTLSKELYRHGMDPYSFISYLNGLGRIVDLKIISGFKNDFSDIDPEECHLRFEIEFEGATAKSEIESVFEFMGDDCTLHILAPHSKISEYISALNELPESPMKLGEILVQAGAITNNELEKAIHVQTMAAVSEKPVRNPIGRIITDEKIIHSPVVDAAVKKQAAQGSSSNSAKGQSIRVDPQKLDSLINLVGELVISGANIRQLSSDKGYADMLEPLSQMSRLIEDVRNSALNVRMVQIGETFAKFRRVVRDLSLEMEKDIELVVSGADTELDKTIVERISDPLMHLVRNSIDHGLKTPEERKALGKNPKGTIWLNAYHETGSIIIEVRDDGEGLNREKIKAKAVAAGLAGADEILSDKEIYQFIFEPGFSTAEKVTSVSGRGVGMDVVRRNIKSLRGSINIDNIDGAGTSFKIQLPLTLAIIDGFCVEVNNRPYIIPLDMITECIEIPRTETKGRDGGNFLNVRGEVLPFLKIRDFFGIGQHSNKNENVVVVEYAKHRAGIVVDRLLGEFQTVIKPLGRIYSKMPWLSGATILGNGDVSLILDVPMLIQKQKRAV